jgi:hypothetical protein
MVRALNLLLQDWGLPQWASSVVEDAQKIVTLEEKCAICNWPKNDYGHIQLIYNSAAKKLH